MELVWIEYQRKLSLNPTAAQKALLNQKRPRVHASMFPKAESSLAALITHKKKIGLAPLQTTRP